MSFQICGLTHLYDAQKPAVLRDVSLTIPEGGVTAVLGMSGSGKTTLLNLMGLLLQPRLSEGKIVCRLGQIEHDYARLSGAAGNRLRLSQFGFVLQSAYLLPHFSCADNVELPLTLRGDSRTERDRRLRRLLDQVDPHGTGLASVVSQRPGAVSGGERQRMAVLRAVIHDPHVVFADEPCASLDPVNAEIVMQLLLDWRQGDFGGEDITDPRERTLIIVSHDIRSACRVADHFLLLKQGQVVRGKTIPRAEMPGGPDAICSEEVERLIRPDEHSAYPASGAVAAKRSAAVLASCNGKVTDPAEEQVAS